MSKFDQFEAGKVRTYSLKERSSKVGRDDLARPLGNASMAAYLDSLPNILAGRDLRILVKKIRRAREQKKPIIWGFGGHVVKVGLAPVLIDLMERGYITALATNGSGIIHDFELAYCGHTSEDVDRELGSGTFGMAEETSRYLNGAISQGAGQGKGIGESVAEMLDGLRPEGAGESLLVQAHRLEIPLTVHVAFGTDIIHNHPSASGEAFVKASAVDFKIFTHQVSQLSGGGVYLNLGSAVILPEVFLKAVSLIRNSGRDLEDFTTANLDFIQHYRPLQNVVRRPVLDTGTGIALTGHHELMVPLLAGLLVHA